MMDKSREQSAASQGEAAQQVDRKQLIKLVIEVGPLLVFFLAYARYGIYAATGVLMAATIIALFASWRLLGRISAMPVVTAGLVVVFGGLTIWLNDPKFIKVKPTIINLGFAAALAGGLVAGRPLLKYVLGEALHLTDEGWKKLTVRWLWFFLFLAGLNEVVWRNFSEGAWVTFKAFGLLPLTFAFAIAQFGLIRQYEARAVSAASNKAESPHRK